MSTTVVINSLVRYDEKKCEQPYPNPFEFTIPKAETANWRMKKLPHSHFALSGRNNLDKGGYEVELDCLSIPVSLMPTPEPVVYFQIDNSSSNIDKGYVTKVKCNNGLCNFDGTNCDCEKAPAYVTYYEPGVGEVTSLELVETCTNIDCPALPPNDPTISNCDNVNYTKLDNGWAAYYDCTVRDGADAKIYHQYKSKTRVSLKYDGWGPNPLNVKVRDTCGNVLTPDSVDLCNICEYAPLFCKDNQVIAILNHYYVPPPKQPKSTLSADCFGYDH